MRGGLERQLPKKKIDGRLPKSAINLEEQLPPNDPLTKTGVVGKFLGVVFLTPSKDRGLDLPSNPIPKSYGPTQVLD
jgi:hypothetical protein